jgi:hypothetical protein
MRRPSQIAVIVVFVAVITMPMLLFVAGVRPELAENRERASFPSLGLGAVVDEDTYAQIESAYTDRLPLRDRAISFYARVQERSTFTDPFRQGLPRGSDGWLYFPDTLREQCTGPPPEEFLAAGRRTFAAAESNGVPFYFLVAPDKVSVYPDHLPTEGLAGVLGLSVPGVAGCTAEWRTALDEAAAAEPWLRPLVGAVRERSNDPEELTFFKIDTHWTDYGAIAQTVEVLDALAPGLWDPSEFQRSADVTKTGDLTLLLGRPQDEQVPGYSVVRRGVTVTRTPEPAGDVTDEFTPVIVTRATSTDAPLIEGTTLFLADSFGRRSLHLMAPYFEELVFVSHDYVLRRRIGSALERRPDRILVEQVQRNLPGHQEALDAAAAAANLRR